MMAVFALFQGYAHQAEMAAGAMATYAPGFVAASMGLYAAGDLLGRLMPDTSRGIALQRAVGGVIAGAGMLFLAT
jgi:urease accessory protein